MERLTSVGSVRAWLRESRAQGRSVGFVPTMGALHAGHLSLIRQARSECDVVVVSIFVNPLQFNDPRDLEKYPRDSERDAALCRDAGVDILFFPDAAEMYPPGFSTHVQVDGPLTQRLEGQFRPGHFQGVCTVVAKLFLIVQPDRAYFGEKDWQQLKVVERMARDLDLPLSVIPVATMREPDGLAMSSRNVRLSPEARQQARILPYLLDTAQELLDCASRESQTDRGPVLRAWLLQLLQSSCPDAQVDYIDVVDPETLWDVDRITDRALVVLAVHIDGVRLIDNRLITDARAADHTAAARLPAA